MKKWIVLFLILLSGCAKENIHEHDEALLISAATSLIDVLERVKDVYESRCDCTLTINFGGSGSLAQQILQGAPVDVFISADARFVDMLEEKGKIVVETRAVVAENTLVMIAHPTFPKRLTIDQLDEVNRIAIGNPETVPAGSYIKQVFESLGRWERYEPSFVFAKDVRQVVSYVETGNVDVGFVYESDVRSAKAVKVLEAIDERLHAPIVYPVAVMESSKKRDEATEFVEFLLSEEGQAIFHEYGFR